MDSYFGLIRPRQHGIANKMAHGFPQKRCKDRDTSMVHLWDVAMMTNDEMV